MAEAPKTETPKKLSIFDLQAKVAKGEKIFQVTAVDGAGTTLTTLSASAWTRRP